MYCHFLFKANLSLRCLAAAESVALELFLLILSKGIVALNLRVFVIVSQAS